MRHGFCVPEKKTFENATSYHGREANQFHSITHHAESIFYVWFVLERLNIGTPFEHFVGCLVINEYHFLEKK